MKITVETHVMAPLERVWAAWITPEDILCWHAASEDWRTTFATVDLREGGEFKEITVMHIGGGTGSGDAYVAFNPSGYANGTPGRFVISPKERGQASSATTTLCLARTGRIKRMPDSPNC